MKYLLLITVLAITGCATEQEPWIQQLNSVGSQWRDPIQVQRQQFNNPRDRYQGITSVHCAIDG